MSIDPTFEFGNFEVTPFTYRQRLVQNKRSGVSPIFLGPTAIHHSKDTATFSRIISSISKTHTTAYITDGGKALCNALRGLPNATALRCFRHFSANCKRKRSNIGIRTASDQGPYLKFVFGEGGIGGIVDSEDVDELCR